MRFQTPLVPARLFRRYKRFLADAVLEADGREVTVHCANPGSMTNLAEPGTRIWLEPNDDPKKKLRFGWRLVDHENGHFTGVDTSLPNRALKAALMARQIAELDYPQVLPERAYGEKSRVDFLLRDEVRPDAWVEVKSVTLSRRAGLAEFPDCVTARGARHMAELGAMARQGDRAVLFFLVQRTDAREVAIAGDIDPTYAAAVAAAQCDGVEVMARSTLITPQAVEIGPPLTVVPAR